MIFLFIPIGELEMGWPTGFLSHCICKCFFVKIKEGFHFVLLTNLVSKCLSLH